jgi:hypothetical protein
MSETIVAADAALAIADSNLVTAVQGLRAALIARGNALKARESARGGEYGVTPAAQSVLDVEAGAYLASVGGYGNAQRIELVTYLPVGGA